jgi:hypothetical protein
MTLLLHVRRYLFVVSSGSGQYVAPVLCFDSRDRTFSSVLLLVGVIMDTLARWRGMMAFCRQRAQFENEDTSFWIEEAKEWDNWIARYDATVPHADEETANEST